MFGEIGKLIAEKPVAAAVAVAAFSYLFGTSR
jgi:hypothetical protein